MRQAVVRLAKINWPLVELDVNAEGISRMQVLSKDNSPVSYKAITWSRTAW